MTITAKFFPAFIAVLVVVISASHVNAACVSLTGDLMQGSIDGSAKQVTSLQTYLAASGYLTATPTGYFGPATFSAVKKYQAAHSVSATGYVGALTRASLQKSSCAVVTTVTLPPTTTTTVVSTPVVTSTPVAPVSPTTPQSTNSIIVTAPASGATLNAGNTYTIQWTGKNTGTYNILLEDSNGIGKGFIATNVYHANTYVWKVGDVTTNNSDGSWNPALPTGTYRIHVEDSVTGAQPSDEPSATFSVIATPLAITSISPSYVTSNASAANPTAVTLYGSGFDKNTMVTLQGMFTSSVYPSYIFPQGNQLIFNVPSGLASGKYSVGLSNTYGSFSSSGIILNVTNN